MCEARQYSDQMQCGRCGLAWDVNDPEPPECPLDSSKDMGRETLDRLKEDLKHEYPE